MLYNKKATIFLLILPLIYNAILAVVNAHLVTVNVQAVALSEILILMSIIFFSYKNQLDRIDLLASAILVMALVSLIFSYVQVGYIFIDNFRNVLVMLVAYIAGRKLTLDSAIIIYKSVIVVFYVFLLLEIFFLANYVELFNPPLYFSNTRGFEMVETNELGVFSNALGFEGRFTLGVFDGPRTSSLMLEQVSFSYLNIVLTLFTMVFWKEITSKWKFVFLSFSVVVLLTNESRLALIVSAVYFLGYYIFPLLHRLLFAYFPILLLGVGLMMASLYSDAAGDNFIGRIVYSFDHFSKLKWADYFGAGVLNVNQLFDSGYTYLISAGTIFSALSIYLFTILAVYSDSIAGRRYAYGLILYFWLALMIAGTSVFSIKSSFILWLFAGYVTRYNADVK